MMQHFGLLGAKLAAFWFVRGKARAQPFAANTRNDF